MALTRLEPPLGRFPDQPEARRYPTLERWHTDLVRSVNQVRDTVNEILAGGGTPAAHAPTHEPGGSDPILNAAWTNVANTFTASPQTLSKAGGVALVLTDPSEPVDFRRVEIRNQYGVLQLNALTDAGIQQGGFQINHLGDTEVSANFQVDGNTRLLGAASVSGLLTVNGFGTHSFSASGAGAQTLQIRNTAAGAANWTRVALGNDGGALQAYLDLYSSSFATAGRQIANGVLFENALAGGISISAYDPSGAIRFYTGGATERMQIRASGAVSVGGASDRGSHKVGIKAEFHDLLDLIPTSDFNGGRYVTFRNASDAVIGSITEVGSSAVAFNTTSDQRLKTDHGSATDLTALRALVVHDFRWTSDGTLARGIFAQETQPIFPRAVTVGSDGDDLSRPWMTDYSKFVPDLIVGWQQHDARLAALEARMTHAE